jgi:hypothetical protein
MPRDDRLIKQLNIKVHGAAYTVDIIADPSGLWQARTGKFVGMGTTSPKAIEQLAKLITTARP